MLLKIALCVCIYFILPLTNQLYLNNTQKILQKKVVIVATGQLKSQIKQENLG